jgi:hypothetical protein
MLSIVWTFGSPSEKAHHRARVKSIRRYDIVAVEALVKGPSHATLQANSETESASESE